jgi:hypothetical protein
VETDWVSVDTISHFDDKFLSPNVLPNIQDLCEFGGKTLFKWRFFGDCQIVKNSIGYADLARFNGSFIESFYVPLGTPKTVAHVKLKFFNNETIYREKVRETEDTCIGISKSFARWIIKK